MIRRAGYTSAPCHGCGSTEPHLKDKVCSSCAKQLKTYAQIVDAQAAGEERKIMAMPERDYAIPYMRHEISGPNSESPIRGPLHGLAMLLSEPTTERISTYDNDKGHYIDDAFLWDHRDSRSRHEWLTFRAINPVAARLLRELQVAIRDGLDAAHKKGSSTGRNLLLSLADGTITNDEFNERAARLDSEGRS